MSAVAERYAAALASVGLERKRDAKGDLSAFLEVFFSSAELRNALESSGSEPGDQGKSDPGNHRENGHR